MADDGLLLNFDLPADAFANPKTTFKGGSWKDRLTAKKSDEWDRKRDQEQLTSQFPVYSRQEEPSSLDERPQKRARTNGSRNQSQPTDREVISSLFTYNPHSTANRESPPAKDEGNIEPSNAPLDYEIANFTSIGLSDTLAGHLLRKLGIKAPTAIQRRAIKQLCENNVDAFIQAETGSGKTLAYLLPVLQRIISMSDQMHAAGEDLSRQSGLFALILAPTRELSKQILSVLEILLTCCHRIVAGLVIGGEKKKSEKARLRKGINILVATPGRLADHLYNTEVLDVSQVRWLVLDEGDRLMELGFEQDIQKIIGMMNLRSKKVQQNLIPGLPERRTTILCSATMKSGVEHLQNISLKDPIFLTAYPGDIEAGDSILETEFSAPSQLKQSYAIVPAKQRLATLIAVLKQTFKRKGSVMKCIVFMSCADSVDFHFELLSRSASSNESNTGEANGDENLNHEKSSTPAVIAKHQRKVPQGGTISEARIQSTGSTFSSKDNEVHLFRLHGSLQQATRTATLKAFASDTQPSVLVCTDVASRGLDLPNIDLVIEYDPPFSKDDHLHRAGRTARAGRDGRAMIFLMPGCEEGYVKLLAEGKPRRLTRHDAKELLKKGFSPTSGIVNNHEWEKLATDWQLEVERWAVNNPRHLEQARRAYQSHIRAYATHVAAERSIFDMQELHLGHLAKAFALRDKPGSIRVPGLRPTKNDGGQSRKIQREGGARTRDDGQRESFQNSNDSANAPTESDMHAGRKKMQAKVKTMGGASEFNLG